jgi:hypothetical protein
VRGLLVPADDEVSVISRRDWNRTRTIAVALGCHQAERVQLGPAHAQELALFVDDDQRLTESPINKAITALLEPVSAGRIFRGPALFVGFDARHNEFADLTVVQMYRLAAEMVRAQRAKLT